MSLRASIGLRALVACAVLVGCGSEVAPPGPASKIELASDPMFTASVGSALDRPLVARVRDARDRLVPGVQVRFDVQQGAATLSSSVATTDTEGLARTTLTMGPIAGGVEVTAAITGLPVSVRFSGIAVPGSAVRLVVTPKPLRMKGADAGDTARLVGGLEDRFGNIVPGGAVSWTSLDPTVASVDGTGLVRAMRIGASTSVIAAAGGFADTVGVSVADPNASPCASAPVALAVGQTMTMDAATGACMQSTTAAEYVAIPVSSGIGGGITTDLRILGTGVSAPSASATVSSARVSAARTMVVPERDGSLDLRLRAAEAELHPRVAATAAARRARAASTARFSTVPTAAVGDLLTLNTSVTSACTTPDNRIGRVVAVTQKAVVVADTANPAGGFTDADYARLGAMFDTLVVPLTERLFGTPSDIDGNGRSVIFYTRSVNQLTPANSGQYVGGWFWSRDLIDKASCPTSNGGEIFFMLVPDPNGVNGNRFGRSFVEQVTVSTIAHEYQHLINASRRAAVPGTPSEEVWLNEGISHVAEEMLLYQTSRTQPRGNVGGTTLATAGYFDLYASYGHSNISRLRTWLRASDVNSPYASGDALATRGAAWAFLRYLADHVGPTDGDVWHRLVNSRTSGLANVEAVFGVNAATSARDWAIAMFADDHVPGVAARHTLPSWNYRTLYPALPESYTTSGPYWLATSTLVHEVPQIFALRGGGAGYYRFAAAANRPVHVRVSTGTGATPPSVVTVTVLRVR